MITSIIHTVENLTLPYLTLPVIARAGYPTRDQYPVAILQASIFIACSHDEAVPWCAVVAQHSALSINIANGVRL